MAPRQCLKSGAEMCVEGGRCEACTRHSSECEQRTACWAPVLAHGCLNSRLLRKLAGEGSRGCAERPSPGFLRNPASTGGD